MTPLPSRILSLMLCLSLLIQNAWVGSPSIPSAHAALNGKALLTQNDFKYIGSFMPPIYGEDFYGGSFALRHVNGETHAYLVGWPQNLYEYKIPALSTTAPFPVGTHVKDWGKAGGDKARFDNGSSNYAGISSLYWDTVDQRLYWTFLDGYNTGSGLNNPTVGFTVFNDAAGTAASYGPWRFTGLGPGYTGQCTTAVPNWFASAYLGGRRIAGGCGYPVSGTAGFNSNGPTITAYDTPNPSVNAEFSALGYKTMLGYPFNNDDYTVPFPPRRNTDYYSDWTGWNPKAGVGYWARDAAGPMVWIDLPTKSGLFYFPTMHKGRYWYYNATTYAQLATYEWWEFDPADLANVAQGGKPIYENQAAATWDVSYPNLGFVGEGEGGPFLNGSWSPQQYPGMPFTRGPDGVAFDPTTNLLYVSVRLTGENNRHLINVYQVGDNIAPPAPAVTGPPTAILNIAPSHLPDVPTGNGNGTTDTAYVTWWTENATSVNLTPYGAVAKRGTLLLKQTATTTYVLKATNAFGTTTQQATVTMNGDLPPPPPPPTGTSCPNGKLCDGTTITGTINQIVCGEDRHTWQCTASGWQSVGGSCTCGTPPPVDPPVINQHPQNVAVSVGQIAGFSVAASAAASYQWQRAAPGSSVFNAIYGATSAAYSTPATVLVDNGSKYRCVVTNAGGSTTSNAATLTVTTSSSGSPVLNVLLPMNGIVITGTTVIAAYFSTGDLTGVASVFLQLDQAVGKLVPSLNGTYVYTAVSTGAHTLKAYLADSAGKKITGTDLQVDFMTNRGISGDVTLPIPTLDLPDYVSVNGTLTAGYPPGYGAMHFAWSIQPKGAAPNSALTRSSKLIAKAQSAIFSTPSSIAGLSNYGLTPGLYTISVQAVDQQGRSSAPAQQDITLVSADFRGVRVYPNPWRGDRHGTQNVTFDHLPLGSSVKLFTVSGHWVKNLTTTIDTAVWDLTNDKGDKVASGIYLYVLKAEGEKVTGQVHVIK